MVNTRLQARSRQTLDRAASSGVNCPRKVTSQTSGTPRQSSFEGGVVRNSVNNTRTVGGSSVTSAEGSDRPSASRKCRSDCKTCPSLVKESNVKSYHTGRVYSTIDLNIEDVHCKLQNYIYVLTCTCCYVQYVGESICPVHLRMNIHRRGKSGCEIAIDHFKNVCPGATFTILILEVLPGNGYLNGKIDQAMLEFRLQREDYWMKTLRTVYPYGLNERTKFMNKDSPIGKLFPSLPRHGAKFVTQRSRTSTISRIADLDTLINSIYSFDKEIRSNECRKLLDSLRHPNLRKLAVEANSRLSTCEDHLKRWYDLLIDIYFTKVYIEEKDNIKKAPKHLLPIFFHNKGLKFIQLKKILRNSDVISELPDQLQSEDPPSIVYSLSSTIRSKIFNYRETVNDIDINDRVTYGTKLPNCDCQHSPFIDSDHGHIVTGDLRIIENQHLRKIISKGPNYREPRNINWKKCKEAVENGTDSFANTMSAKYDLRYIDIVPWRNKVLQMVDAKIAYLKRKTKYCKVNPVLQRTDVIEYLQNLHSKFVLVPIDKAANNVSIICKRFYVEVMLKEIGILGEGNNTYLRGDLSKEHIIHDNVEYAKRLQLNVTDKELDLPAMYWIPKKHKQPTGKRFIIASKQCSTKQISSAVSNVFKLIYKQVENFHKKAKFLSNYNKFWVLQNCNPILQTLNRINRKKNAKSISTFDFSTLYTKLPHDKLIKELSEVIDFVFNSGNSKYVAISSFGKAYWSKNKPKTSIAFTKNSLKLAVKHLVQNCFFTVGNVVMRQAIGIPMGIDPAPFWANLFLYQFEQRYMSDLISTDKVKARHFHSTKRFIDDLCAINDGNLFGRVYRDIYPEELELKLEHSGTHASFLNLDITINEGIFVYKLFDKRDAFPFSIVRMPHMDSNIPESIFYSALVGEFLRIARSTLLLEDFQGKAKSLCQRMQSQGANRDITKRYLQKIISRHEEDFSRFTISSYDLIQQIL